MSGPSLPRIFGSCCVCRENDSRALTTTRLANGEVAIVCGTHELMHRRQTEASGAARSESELRAGLRQRRSSPRRGEGGDELGLKLSEAFASTDRRRTGTDRRR